VFFFIYTDVIEPVLDFAELRNTGASRDSGNNKQQQQQQSTWPLSKTRLQQHNKVNLTSSVIYDGRDGLRALLNWTHPPGKDGVGVGDVGELVDYELIYILQQCGVYPDLPPCPYPQDLYSAEVLVPRWQEVSL
jgi:hypothetical protein